MHRYTSCLFLIPYYPLCVEKILYKERMISFVFLKNIFIYTYNGVANRYKTNTEAHLEIFVVS